MTRRAGHSGRPGPCRVGPPVRTRCPCSTMLDIVTSTLPSMKRSPSRRGDDRETTLRDQGQRRPLESSSIQAPIAYGICTTHTTVEAIHQSLSGIRAISLDSAPNRKMGGARCLARIQSGHPGTPDKIHPAKTIPSHPRGGDDTDFQIRCSATAGPRPPLRPPNTSVTAPLSAILCRTLSRGSACDTTSMNSPTQRDFSPL